MVGADTVLIGGILAGLVIGLLVGGRLSNLAHVRLRWVSILFLAVIIRFGRSGRSGRASRSPRPCGSRCSRLSFGLLLVGLWVNRARRASPGLHRDPANTIAVVVNGGHMPIWRPSLVAAGFGPDTSSRRSTSSWPATR